MFLWLIRQLLSIRKIVAGRNHPHQLAWGLALGILVGVVPHGNLLAVALIALVLTLRVNHAMATLTGVAVAFSATALDPYTHLIGRYVLTHPNLQAAWAQAWQLPLVPWTDINNTVVIGSLLVGLGAVLPVYAASYPLFRYFTPPPAAPPESPAPGDPAAPAQALEAADNYLGAGTPLAPTAAMPPTLPLTAADPALCRPPHGAAAMTDDLRPTERWRSASGTPEPKPGANELVMMETQIDVIRLKDYGPAAGDSQQETGTRPAGPAAPQAATPDQAEMNQALSYLLRRLRDSQQGKAA